MKTTAVMLQITGDATLGNDGHMQQIVIFPGKVVYRRSITPDHRPHWRPHTVGDPAEWVQHAANLTGAADTPLALSHGPVLIEVTENEVSEAKGGTWTRKIGLRFQRVREAMDAAGESPTVGPREIDQFVNDWQTAMDDDNDTWVEAHIHPRGMANDDPDPDPTGTTAPAAPAPEPTAPTPAGVTWLYPEVDRAGYVIRPNGERYKTRLLDGTRDVQILRDSRAWGEHVLLTGEPGTGKTALIEAAFGTEMVSMLGTEDTEVADFIGSYVTRGLTPAGDVLYGWCDAALSEAVDRDVPLYVDECGVILTKVLTVLYSMMDGRKRFKVTTNPDRGELVAGPGFIVVAATNPNAPGVRFSEALTSRFDVQIEVGTDFTVLRELGVEDELVTAGENLATKFKNGAVTWAPQARELLQADKQWKRRSAEFALRNLIGKCPERDRDEVTDVLSSVTGRTLERLTL